MLPWETLRRLLGLPSGMELPNAVDLARMAIEEPRRARLIGMALMVHTPTETPAAMLVAALERGALLPEVAAELIGFSRHPSGYATLARMLHDPDPGEEASVAGVAMARILGDAARDDLTLALRMAPARPGRDGAALGLSELGTAEDAVSIIDACIHEQIRIRVAAGCAAQLPFDVELVSMLLESPSVRERRLGTEIVFELLSSADEEAKARLTSLGERAKNAVQFALEDGALYLLPEKRDALLAWVYGHK